MHNGVHVTQRAKEFEHLGAKPKGLPFHLQQPVPEKLPQVRAEETNIASKQRLEHSRACQQDSTASGIYNYIGAPSANHDFHFDSAPSSPFNCRNYVATRTRVARELSNEVRH